MAARPIDILTDAARQIAPRSIGPDRRTNGKHTHKPKTHCDVSVLAATPELRFDEIEFDHASYNASDKASARPRMEQLLVAELAALYDAYELILFDCPPGFSTLPQAAIASADAIVSPVHDEPLSVWSLQTFREFGSTMDGGGARRRGQR